MPVKSGERSARQPHVASDARRSQERAKSKSSSSLSGRRQVKTVESSREKRKSASSSAASGLPRRALSVDVLNVKGKAVGKISLPKEIFGAKVNEKLMAQAVRVYLANQRLGTVSTKTRGEVKGSTRKLYRQKGTGRARAGSIRSPLRVGGGVVFGPKPKDYTLALSKKMKRSALFSALSSKLKEKSIHIIVGLENISSKTKKMQAVLKDVGFANGAKILVVLSSNTDQVVRATRNIEGVDACLANKLSAYDVLSHKNLLLAKDAVKLMEETWIR